MPDMEKMRIEIQIEGVKMTPEHDKGWENMTREMRKVMEKYIKEFGWKVEVDEIAPYGDVSGWIFRTKGGGK